MAQKVRRTDVVAKVKFTRVFKDGDTIKPEEGYTELVGCNSRDKVDLALSKQFKNDLVSVTEISYSIMTKAMPRDLFDEMSTLEKEVELTEEEMIERKREK